jgi:hypothetical protein
MFSELQSHYLFEDRFGRPGKGKVEGLVGYVRRKFMTPLPVAESFDALNAEFLDACTNIIEKMNGTIRRVCRNVKRWHDAKIALRWTAAGMMEAAKGFRRLKAHKQLPILRAALLAHQARHTITANLEQQAKAA